MAGLLFETRPRATAPVPNRADVACFIGLVPLRSAAKGPQRIESWEAFDQGFAWDRRPLDLPDQGGTNSPGGGEYCATYLGAAVRSFFAQGGRCCYVVRVADPPPARTLAVPGEQQEQLRKQRDTLLEALLPGYPQPLSATPLDPASWEGIGALLALPEVSYVAFPDLADLVAVDRPSIPLLAPVALPETFVECSTEFILTPLDRDGPSLQAPRCDDQGFRTWASVVAAVVEFLRRWRREVQLVAAVPLPEAGLDTREVLQESPASGFAQFVYPWVRTPVSDQLPGSLESPEGVLIGLLARNALSRGSFRSAVGLDLGDVRAVEPALTRQQRQAPLPGSESPGKKKSSRLSFTERVSLLGPTPRGLRLLSDVTTSLDPSYRLASVHRLVTVLVRAARSLGELHSFEASGEPLWRRLRDSLETLLTQLWQNGALAGASAEEAFSVRCDRTTTSQQDLDSGLVVAEVLFVAAVPIEEIRVVLTMQEGGQVTIHGPPP